MVSRLEQICQTYCSDGILQEGEGAVLHILDSLLQELRSRLARAWQHMAARKWEHRQGFEGLKFEVCEPRAFTPLPVVEQ